jgi:hypothetical protein
MTSKLAFIVLICVCLGAPPIKAESDQQLSKRIIGTWVERKAITFRPDGTWELRKFESLSYPVEPGLFTWSIHNGKLIQIRDQYTFANTIKSLTQNQLVLQSDTGGKPTVYKRTHLVK